MAAPKKKKTTKKKVVRETKKAKKIPPKKKVTKVAVKKRKANPKKIIPARNATRNVAGGKKKVVPKRKSPSLVHKYVGNPIMGPAMNSGWESEAVFNPGAIIHNGRVHLFYRALGPDGMSRVGYASSADGIHFDERLPYPVYTAESIKAAANHHPYTSPAVLFYDRLMYASGGGWGGCEDPRAVKLDGRIYMTFNMLNNWDMRVGFTSISEKDFENKKWNWKQFKYLTRPGDRQKNWVLFPEKINGKFAIFHNLDMGDPNRVGVAYVDELDMYKTPSIKDAPDPQLLPDHLVAWHVRTRSASAPPIKTRDGWLLFYHAMDRDHSRYKVGALLLDLKDPTKVLHRASEPLIEPEEWYENDWKPGIVYASGAVVKDGILIIYYGGGDKHIAVAYTNLEDFIDKLKKQQHPTFTKKSVSVK